MSKTTMIVYYSFIPLLIILILTLIYMLYMPDKSYQGDLLPLTEIEMELKLNLREHIYKLANSSPRNAAYLRNLRQSGTYIKETLSRYGYEAKVQEYKIDDVVYENIIAEKKGTISDNIIIVGAHYDSVMPNSIGANDNATGVAAVMELARLFKNKINTKTIQFVLFVNEEPPFFITKNMGSIHYAKKLKAEKVKVEAMFSLETLGYYSDEKGSQMYPFPLGLFYPSKGNFIAFVGNMTNRPLVTKSVKIFRTHAHFPSEGGAIPSFIAGVGWSDHWSFWQMGYPAIMVTDTALFRYPYYHTPEDTPDKITYDSFTRVVAGLEPVIFELSK